MPGRAWLYVSRAMNDVGVAEELLDELGMRALQKQDRGASVSEVVEARRLREPGALEEPGEER